METGTQLRKHSNGYGSRWSDYLLEFCSVTVVPEPITKRFAALTERWGAMNGLLGSGVMLLMNSRRKLRSKPPRSDGLLHK